MQAAYLRKLLPLFCILALACNGPAVKQAEPAKPVSKPVLASNITKHLFSDPNTPDVFKLSIRGDSLLKGTCTFEIITAAGKSIYHEEFKAQMLLNSLLADDNKWTPQQQEEYIRKRVKEFFLEKQFKKPAIDKSDKFDQDLNRDIKVFNALKADHAAIGFSYLFDYEYSRDIAYVKELGKVVVYWGCC